jgi:hypothetical protein
MENEMEKSPRPKARPMSKMATKSSPRPKAKPADLMETHNLMRAMRGTDAKATKEDLKAAKKMAMGGKCRGMGAATKGGNYKG